LQRLHARTLHQHQPFLLYFQVFMIDFKSSAGNRLL
jgi:hypothetical protein